MTLLPIQFSRSTRAKSQVLPSNENLNGSERTSVSRAGGVMPCASGRLNGERAAMSRAEHARPLSLAMPVQLSANMFVNYLQAKATKRLARPGSRNLVEIGGGAERQRRPNVGGLKSVRQAVACTATRSAGIERTAPAFAPSRAGALRLVTP